MAIKIPLVQIIAYQISALLIYLIHKSNSLWKSNPARIVEICMKLETVVLVGILSQATFNRITRLDLHCKID